MEIECGDDPKIYMETLGVYFKVLKVNYNV